MNSMKSSSYFNLIKFSLFMFIITSKTLQEVNNLNLTNYITKITKTILSFNSQ